MKKVIVIKFEVDVPYEERKILEDKFRRGFEEGLIILPHYCTGFVTEINDMEVKV